MTTENRRELGWKLERTPFVLGALAVTLAMCAGYETMWGALAGPFMLLGAVACLGSAGIYTISTSGLTAANGARRVWPRLALGLVFIFLMGGGFYCCAMAAREVRTRQIERAAKAGLANDCLALLATYQNNDQLKRDRIWEIGPKDPRFAALPKSILMLDPNYVTIESSPWNVGICKNGFAGFAEGVRVFADEQDAGPEDQPREEGSIHSKRIAPHIYFWQQQT
jgi:hypothetical protein